MTFPKLYFPEENFIRRVASFYIFTNLFNVRVNKRQLSYLLLYTICCDVLVWLKTMKKIQPHTDR